MELKINEENNSVIVTLVGRLDTAAAAECAADFAALNEKANKKVILECSDLSYVASSGLRLFLSLRKSSLALGGSVVIRNISNDIREVFAMTGFTSLFTIE